MKDVNIRRKFSFWESLDTVYLQENSPLIDKNKQVEY